MAVMVYGSWSDDLRKRRVGEFWGKGRDDFYAWNRPSKPPFIWVPAVLFLREVSCIFVFLFLSWMMDTKHLKM